MSSLDKELSEALNELEAAPAAAPVTAPNAAPNSRSRKSIGLLIALLIMAGGLLTLVMTSFEGEAIYSKGVDELLAAGSGTGERTLRVQGVLVKGTLTRRDEPCEYRFRIAKNGKDVEVRYPQCVVPDTFRDVPNMDVEVTATGRMEEDHFQASHIMAKCPSKYEMKQLAASGETAPHGSVASGASPAAKEAY